MDKIKKFIDCFVPVYNCNFKCNYCYISTWSGWEQAKKTKKIEYDVETIKLAFSKERWGGPVMINFCGAGETLICNELLPIVKGILEEGHYCMIVTNGTITPKFIEMSKWPEKIKKHLFIKFSYHFLELRRLNLTEKFFENVNLMKKSNISFTVELTPSDIYIPYIEEIKKECKKYTGAYPHITVCRVENSNVPIMTTLTREDYIKTWSQFNSALFDFKIKIFGEKRKEFCYAGMWSYVLELASGELRQCYRGKVLQNIFQNVNDSIVEKPIGCNCCDAHCWNGHAFLAFGDIPEMETPTFEQERNRETSEGTWVTKEMADFMSTKLIDSNNVLSENEKRAFNKKSKTFKNTMKIKNKIKRMLNR